MMFLGSIIIFLTGASALKYKDCGSTVGNVINVDVSGCEDSDVCPIERGSTVTIAVSFEALTDSESLRVVSHAILGGVLLPFQPPQPDGCVESGISCPVKEGETYKYVTEIDVSENFPKMKAEVKWELKSKNRENFFCVQVPAETV